MPAIVIEGADGTGKTTLAREFERRGWRYVHFGVPKDSEDLLETYLQAILDARGANVVYDRLHVGELIYGKVIRNEARITLQQIRLLNRILLGDGGALITCRVPIDVMLANWRARKGSEYVEHEEKLVSIATMYDLLVRDELRALRGWYDLDYTSFGHYVNKFVDGLSYRYGHKIFFPPLPPGVNGATCSRYLIVGERPGGERDLCFCAMDGSSGYLNTALWEAGYAEKDLAFVNAIDERGATRNLRNIYFLLFNPTVIALGRVAQDACAAAGVPHLAAPHPQFWRRFKIKKRDEYVALLRSFK